MKLSIWQWVGVALLVLAMAMYLYRFLNTPGALSRPSGPHRMMTADPPPPATPSVAETPAAAEPLSAAAAGGSLRADVLSGYALTASRLAAWAGVSAIVFRGAGEPAFALLALLRATITLVGYTSLGLGPAMVRAMAAARATPASDLPPAAAASADVVAAVPGDGPPVLGYEPRRAADGEPDLPPVTEEQRVYASGSVLGHLLAGLALVVTVVYVRLVSQVHRVPEALEADAAYAVLCFGAGMAMRIASEPSSAALQARGRLAVDNVVLAAGEWAWLALVWVAGRPGAGRSAFLWMLAAAGVGVARVCARRIGAPGAADRRARADPAVTSRLLAFGATLSLAQLADFLYAPTDYVLINRFLSPYDLADYAPAVQVDAALLMVVGGLAMALFPHAAVAHAGGHFARLRRLYVRATLASAAALLLAGGATLALSPWLFKLWLGDDLPGTRALLPLVLVHTVVGGSSAVGRSVLLGMGKVRALTVSALIAGVANVGLSAAFATVGGLGLRGIVLGTVVVVVARCAVWMPWYVLQTLGKEAERRVGAADEVAGIARPAGDGASGECPS